MSKPLVSIIMGSQSDWATMQAATAVLTELGVPLMFDYSRVTSVQIFAGFKDLSGKK